jgi:putative endonuclease
MGTTAWFVYVLVSEHGDRTYVGITTDPTRRLGQHNGLQPGGARSTRGGRPWTLAVELGPYVDRGTALRLERLLKRRRRGARLCVDARELEARLGDEPSGGG